MFRLHLLRGIRRKKDRYVLKDDYYHIEARGVSFQVIQGTYGGVQRRLRLEVDEQGVIDLAYTTNTGDTSSWQPLFHDGGLFDPVDASVEP